MRIRLYRLALAGCLLLGAASILEASPYLKTRLEIPGDPFFASGANYQDPHWVKFTILLPLQEPAAVFFQDCQHYKFHYDFASECLAPFKGMTRSQFDLATLHASGQQAALGALLIPPANSYGGDPIFPEYAIQLVRLDPYSKEETRDLFRAAAAAVQAPPNYQAYYFPTYEQSAAAESNRAWLESQGVRVGSAARWLTGNVQYSPGWALGILRYVPGGEVNSAFQQGRLGINDILLTDGVPADMPMTAGIVSLTPSTPNCHVALLAQSYGVPFVYFALESDQRAAQELVGRKVILRSYQTNDLSGSGVEIIDVEDALSPELESAILRLKLAPDLKIAAMTPYGAYSAPTDILVPGDNKYFGGKAANFGLLRTSIPNNSPVAAAFSFDLWNAFMDQTIAGGKTLRTEIDDRLASYTAVWPPANPLALSQALASVRSLFTNNTQTVFSPELQTAVIATLTDSRYGFNPRQNIRFRSSTNVEDSDVFIGAGLYDSFSGCLADDQDMDDKGPCICDPVEAKERGVFRAIRKVFASFYNDNAVLERLRYRIPKNEVGMALLAHHSFPDETELANGVATLENQGYGGFTVTFISQIGAISVTNPEDDSIAEEVNAYCYGSPPAIYPSLVRASNRVVIGDTVLKWDAEYKDLVNLLLQAGARFQAVTGKTKYSLDFEYKKTAPDNHLEIKQIREVPRPDTTPSITPFLMNDPEEYVVHQGEYGNVFSNHRLKSRWLFQINGLAITESNLAGSIYSNVSMEYVADGTVRTQEGRPSDWPKAKHSAAADDGGQTFHVMDEWRMDRLSNPRRYELLLGGLRKQVSPSECPLIFPRDLWNLTCTVTHDRPVQIWGYDPDAGAAGMIPAQTESVQLQRRPKPLPDDVPQVRKYDGPASVSIEIQFYWPNAGGMIIKTSPLARWNETVIRGYTSEPLVLRGEYSQTYRPEHHNFGEHFLFEPELEPGLSPAARRELRAADVRMIHLILGLYGGSQLTTYGYDPQIFSAWVLY